MNTSWKWAKIWIGVAYLCVYNFCPQVSNIKCQSYPAGFTQAVVANGLVSPTNFAFAPDGRIFICEKAGKIRIVKNGILLSTPFLSITVNSAGERGLLGIAFDPNFAINKYVYVYYTISSGANNRLSRFTANNDVAVLNSETILYNFEPLSSATNHNGGTLKFGPDGKLYIAIGENTQSQQAQNLANTFGKILRVNSNGTPAVGNPFYAAANPSKKLIWCWGLRNPFSFDFDDITGKLFINDVGSSLKEEINDGTNGNLNFGWPAVEGIAGNASFTDPLFAYSHGATNTTGCAISGGTFLNAATTNYPSQYDNKYFFIDYCNNWMCYINPLNSTSASPFATGLPTDNVVLEQGPDGNLYFLSRGNSKLYKVVYNNATAPSIVTQPVGQSIAIGQSATFTVTVTGATPLTYQWRRNGINITNANTSSFTIPTVTNASAGTYTCLVSNAYGSLISAGAVLTVLPFNAPPVAVITSPTTNSLYSGGMVINYNGSATDAEDGNISGSNFQWEILFFHDNHIHPGPSGVIGAKSGSFTIPTNGETSANVYYRLYLYVKDSKGLYDTAFVDLLPKTSTITINTTPADLQIRVDGQSYSSPVTITSVEGVERQIVAVSPQTNTMGVTYEFDAWSNGLPQSFTLTTPVNNVSYSANFTTSLRAPENPENVVSGLHFDYFEGVWSSLPDFNFLLPVLSGNIPAFDLSPRLRNDDFAFVFKGFVDVPTDGYYTFYTGSDDGSRLYIGDALVVDNDGLHPFVEASGSIGLKAGKHAIRVEFFEAQGAEILDVSFAGPSISKKIIPPSALFQESVVIELTPIADAYIRSGTFANNAFGLSDASYLECKRASNQGNTYRVSFLKFDISGIENAIISAQLKLYGALTNAYNGGVSVGAWKIPNGTWNENTITWNNAPTLPTNLISSKIIGSTNFATHNFDLKPYIEERRSGGFDRMSIAISCQAQSSGTSVRFFSKEATTNVPRLVIILNPSLLPFVRHEQIAPSVAQSLKLFPQPAASICQVTMPYHTDEYAVVKVMDMSGNVVSQSIESKPSFDINTSSLESGIYLVTIATQQVVYSGKMIVVHPK